MNCINNYRLDKNNCRSDKNNFKDSTPNNPKLKIPVLIFQRVSITPPICACIISLDHQNCDCGGEKKGEPALSVPRPDRKECLFFFFSFSSILPQSQSILCKVQKTVILRMNRECSSKNEDLTDKGLYVPLKYKR